MFDAVQNVIGFLKFVSSGFIQLFRQPFRHQFRHCSVFSFSRERHVITHLQFWLGRRQVVPLPGRVRLRQFYSHLKLLSWQAKVFLPVPKERPDQCVSVNNGTTTENVYDEAPMQPHHSRDDLGIDDDTRACNPFVRCQNGHRLQGWWKLRMLNFLILPFRKPTYLRARWMRCFDTVAVLKILTLRFSASLNSCYVAWDR